MRRPLLLAALLLALGACKERAFDDRYGEAEKSMRRTADGIDAELTARASESALPAKSAEAPSAAAGRSAARALREPGLVCNTGPACNPGRGDGRGAPTAGKTQER